jgi:hypothetical protein
MKFNARCDSCGQRVIAAVEQETHSRHASFPCPGCGSAVEITLPYVPSPILHYNSDVHDDDDVSSEELERLRAKMRLRSHGLQA